MNEVIANGGDVIRELSNYLKFHITIFPLSTEIKIKIILQCSEHDYSRQINYTIYRIQDCPKTEHLWSEMTQNDQKLFNLKV